MDDVKQSVMVALLPTTSEWCHIDLPHLTLVYVGEIPNLSPTEHNVLAKTTLDLSLRCAPLTLVVIELDIFGSENDTEVLTLEPTPELLAMRSIFEPWNASEYPFNPHVTVGPLGSFEGPLPSTITFNQIAVGWGGDILSYNLV